MLKLLRRFADSRTVEGRIVSILVVITLAFMAWDVNALRSAFADEDATLAVQAEDADKAAEKAEKEAAEKAAKEKAEKEAAEKAAKEQAEKEAAEKAAREAAEKEAAEKEAAEKAEKEQAAKEAAEREAAEKEAAEREQAEEKSQPAAPAEEKAATSDDSASEHETARDDGADNAAADTEAEADEADNNKPEANEPETADADTNADADDNAEDTDKEADKKSEEEAYPAVVLYAKAGGVTVKLTAPQGALPEGAQLRVRDVTSDKLADQAEQVTGATLAGFTALDITIIDKNSHEVQPKKAVNVTFVGAHLETDDVSVYHMDGGGLDRVRTLQADSNTQSFDARSFSVYLILAMADDDTPRYTVTFVTENDDGTQTTVDQLVDQREGATLGALPEAPFKAGYHFAGWVDTATGEPVTTDTTITGDITAVAQFEAVKVYQVTVEHWYHNPTSNEDIVFNRTTVEMEMSDLPYTIESPVSTTVGTDVNATNPTYIPTQEAVVVTAETLAAAEIRDGKGYLTLDVEYVPYDTTYYVVYKLKNLNGQGYSEVDRVEAQGVHGSTVTAPKKDITGGVFERAETATITESGQELSVYYARAQYKVTFDVNGGNYVDAQMVPYGGTATLPTPTRTGHTFAGWYADQALSQAVTAAPTITAPTTLYAKWTANKVAYTVVYTVENADDDGYSFLASVTRQATVGAEVTEAANASGKPSALDTTNFTYDSATTARVKADGSTVVTVKYRRNVYTIKWNGDVYNTSGKRRAQNQGTGSITAKYGASITQAWVQAFNTPYPQYAWSFTTKNNDKIISIDTMPSKQGLTTNSDGSLRLVAFDFSTTKEQTLNYWLENYESDQTVERNGKTYGLYKGITAKFNYLYDDSDFYAIVGYTKDGYDASYTSNGRTQTYTLGQSTPNANLVANFYYAANTYTLALYDADGALITTQQLKLGADISEALADNQPAAPIEGAEWLGWFTDADHANAYAGNNKMPTGLALYANWQMPERSITFMDVAAEGAEPTELATETYAYGETAEAITPDARAGYTFQGWYTNAAGTALYDFDRPLTQDVVVYSKWSQDVLQYTVKYVDASDPTREVLPSKTVSSPALLLGQTITEKAAVVAGMLPNEGEISIDLALTGNEIVFTYTSKQSVITYDVKYVLASDPDIQVATPREGVQVSGDIVSVKEVAAPVDYSLLASQGVTDVETLHPESEVVEYAFSTGQNTIVFKYVPYQSTTFTVNYLDMDGNPIPGVPTQTASAKVGSGYTVPTGIAGYVLNHLERDGVDQGKRTYFVAQSGAGSTIDVYYQARLTVTAANKTKVYDGEALVSEGLGDCTVSGLQAGHELASIEYDGVQTAAGSSATTPKNAQVAGPANADYYAVEYVSGTLTVTKPSVVVTIVGDVVEATYDGQPHTAGYTVQSISNDGFDASYIQFNGVASSVSRTHVGTTELVLAGMFSTAPAYAGNYDVTYNVTNGSVTVVPATLTVRSDSAEKTYDGTPLTAPGCSVEGLVAGETLPVTAIGTQTDAGSSWNDVEFDWAAATAQQSDYQFEWKNGKLTVSPATLTVTACDQTYVYNGAAQGEIGATYTDPTAIGGKVRVSGLATGDTLASITLDGNATKVGVYEGAIVPSAAEGALGHATQASFTDNYQVEYMPGTLTISRNETDLALTAHDGGGVYNGSAYGLADVAPSIASATVEYRVGDDGEWTTEAPSVVNVADSLEACISVRATLEGYAPAQVDGLSIAVTPRTATITAASGSKVYGADDPADLLEAQLDGVLEGDELVYSVAREAGEDVGTYVVAATAEAEQGNYAVTTVDGVLTITPAEVTVVPDAATKVYGAEDPELTATVNGLVNSADSIEYTLVRDAGENVGSYAIAASAAELQGNYRVSVATGEFTITPAAATVTADAATKVYGDADPAFTATIEGLVNGDDAGVIAYTVARDAGENVGEYAITPDGAAVQGNYAITYASGVFTITPATVTVTADDAGKVYGEADPEAYGAQVTGLRNGDAYDTIAYTATRAAGENVGDYDITPTGAATQGNYQVVFEPGTFTISPATVVVAANDNGKTYGTPDPELTATVTGLVGSDTVDYTLARAAGEDVGSYAITATGAAEQGNYLVQYAPGAFTITKAKATVTVADATSVYGDPDPTFEVTISGLQNDDPESVISYTLAREPGTDVGAYPITLDGASVQGNYEVVFVPATLTITPAPVTVVVESATKVYGDADPEFSATVEGLKNGDVADVVSYTLSRAPGENVGDYAITATGAADQGNYAVSFEAGTLAITPASLTVSAISTGKVYGDADPELSASVVGLKNGDMASVVSYTLSRANGEDVGDYAITPAGEAEQGNYLVEYAPGTFTIAPAGTLELYTTSFNEVYSGSAYGVAATPSVVPGTTVEYSIDGGETWSADFPTRTDVGETAVTARATNANYRAVTAEYTLVVTPKDVVVTAADAAKTYGEADPDTFAYRVSGLVAGESSDLIAVDNVTRAPGEDAGEYAITPTGKATQGNYAVTYEPGTFTIAKKNVTITGTDASKVYGDADPELSATVEGLVGSDTLEYTVSRSEGENVGTYAVIPAATATANYEITLVAGHFTITKATAIVTATPASKVYGQADPTFAATVTGLVGSDTLVYTVTRAEGEDVGTYALEPVGDATQDNYDVQYRAAEFSITPAEVTVTAIDKVQAFGGNPVALTAVVSGLVRGDSENVISYELSRAAGNDAGTYAITPAGNVLQGNYQVKYVPGTYTIVPRVVTVTATAASKVYGTADPTFTATVDGLLFGNTVDYTLARNAGEAAGSYTITPAGAERQGNYLVEYVAAPFTISKAELTVTADAKTQVYGAPARTLTATVSGLAGGDSTDVVQYTLAREAGDNVGTYAIVPTLLNDPANYTVRVENGTYDITPATVTVAAVSTGKTYGEADPELTATVTGLVAGDSADVLAYTLARAAGENAGTYPITPTGAASQGNYTVVFAPGTFIIGRAAVTVAADNKVKTYGNPDPTLTATVTGLVAGDSASVLSYELARAAGEDAGSYTITPTGAIEQGNYLVSFVDGTLQIAASGELTVSGTSVYTVYNGQAHGEAAVANVTEGTTLEYSVDEGDGWSTEVPTRTNAGVSAISVRATNPNYETAYASYTLDVAPRSVVVAANDASKVYGTDDPELAATVTGLVAGENAAEVLSYELAREAGEDVGAYAITAEGAADQGNYAVTFKPGTFTISRSADWTLEAEGVQATYDGTAHAIPAATASVEDGTAISYRMNGGAWSSEPPSAVDAGVYTIEVRATNPNYVDLTTTVTLVVERAALTVRAVDAGKTYGEADPVLHAQVEGLVEGDAPSVVTYTVTRAAGEDVGTYAITPAGATEQGNYTVSFEPATFTIGRATATVTVDDAGKTYGDADPTFTAQVTGLVAGDTADVLTYSIARERGEDAGTYAISALGSAEQGNYLVEYVPATFTIGRATATVTPDAKAKSYGEDDPVLTATVSGLKNGDVEAVITYTLAREAGEDVGSYAITASGAAEQGNYDVVFGQNALVIGASDRLALSVANIEGEYTGAPYGQAAAASVLAGTTVEYRVNGGAWSTAVPTRTDVGTTNVLVRAVNPNFNTVTAKYTITVTPKAAVVRALDAGKTYGEAGPASFDYTVEGLVAGEPASLIAVDSVTRAAGQDVGTYPITPKGAAEQGNYTVTYEPGVFTILPKGVVVAAVDAEKVYGADDPTLTATVNGLVNAQDSISYTLARAVGEDVGAYAITAAGAAVQGNYAVTFEDATFTITRAAITVTADDATQVYGGAPAALSAQVKGLVAGDDANVVDYTLSRDAGEDVGEYAITAAGSAVQGNYKVTYAPGTYTITPATATVVAHNATKTYGQIDPALAATVNGLVNGDAANVIAYTLARAAGEDVGTYAITPAGAAEQGNYLVEYKPATFTIVASGELALAVTDTSATYTGKPISAAAAVPSVVPGTSVEYRLAGASSWSAAVPTGLDVGTYTVEARASNANYVQAEASYTLTITPAPVVVAAADASKVYGAADPAFEASVSGLVNGESADLVSYTLARAAGEDVGAYAITPAGDAVQGNYAVTFTPATFTITPATVTVVAADASKVYGAADPTFTAEVTGLVGDDAADLIEFTLTREAGEDALAVADEGLEPQAIGYAIVPSGNARQGNYLVEYQPANFIIEQRPVEVTSGSASKVYDGEPLVAESAQVTSELDFLEGEAPAYAYTGTQTLVGSSENTFAVVAGSSSRLANYRLSLVPGTLLITAADGDKAVDPGKVVVKTHEGMSFTLGEQAVFTITATNIYDEPKTITLEEKAGVELAQSVFENVAPGASIATTATHTITEADVAAGSFDNVVTARFDGEDAGYEGSDSVTVVEQRLDVSKSILNPQPEYRVGDTIMYLITVRNAGTATLHEVTVSDQMGRDGMAEITAAGDGVVNGQDVVFASLEPGDTRTITAQYTVRDADVGLRVTNAVVASTPESDEATDTDGTESEPVAAPYTLTIHYVYASGAMAAPDYTATLFAGDAFEVESPTISGYTPDYRRIVSGEAGMPARDVELTVVYRANEVPGVAPVPSPMPTPGSSSSSRPATVTPDEATSAPARSVTGVVNVDQNGNPSIETIDDDVAPAGLLGSWSLFDLLATLVTLLVGLVMAIGLFGRRRRESDSRDDGSATAQAAATTPPETEREQEPDRVVKRRRILRVVNVVLAVAAVLLLLFTQDFTQPMAWFDQWTIVFAILLVVQLLVAFFARKKKQDEDKNDGDGVASAGPAPDAATA